MGIFKRRYPFKKKDCPHMRIRDIYGDEIIAAGGRRSMCLDCGTFFKSLGGKN